MADKDDAPSQEDKATTQTPPDGDAGDKVAESQAPSKVPEKFVDKSINEVIEMYGGLERKMGQQSVTVAEAKQLKENQQKLAEAIYAKPELAKQVEDALREKSGLEPIKTDSSNKKTQDRSNGEASESIADLRRAHENRVISDFSQKFGLNDLDSDKRSEVMKKVGNELADMLDPTGKKSMTEVLTSVSLDKLPGLLEKSHFLANMENIMSGKADSVSASIGRFSSSSSVKTEGQNEVLSNREKEMARNLNVKEEDYLKSKLEISKE